MLPPDKGKEFVVTEDTGWYWVRENNGAEYWPSRGLFFFKFNAIRYARKLAARSADARRLDVCGQQIVWSSHD